MVGGEGPAEGWRPVALLMVTIIGAMAQLERDIIRERVKAGLDRARARGVRLDRPIASVETTRLAALQREGLSLGEIARRVGCSRSTVRQLLRAASSDGARDATAMAPAQSEGTTDE